MSNKPENEQKHEGLKPDPETLHKTDPQDNMKGPVSSFMQGVKDEGEKNDEETKKEADKKKDENT
jgi:hypothetical protein